MRRLHLLPAALLLAACAPAAPRPGPAVTLADAGASDITVAHDARTGTSYAAWIQPRDGSADVLLARTREGARWSAPVRVNHLPGDAAAHEQAPPQVAVAPDGAVLVLWHNARAIPGRRFVASNLRLARSEDGGRSFAPAVFVNDDAHGPPSSHSFHDIAIAADGTILVSWIDGRRRDEARTRLASSDAPHAHHDALPGSEVRVARSHDGGASFEPAVVVTDRSCPCCRTSIAAAPDGRVLVAFRLHGSDGVRDVHVARSTDGGATFDAPAPVHADGWRIDGCPHAGPSIDVDGTGRVHVAWFTGAPNRAGLHYASSMDGIDFAPPVPLLTGEHVPPAQVKLVADREGAWLAWDDRGGTDPRIRIAYVRGGTLGPPALLAGSGTSPALARNARGALLGWTHAGSVQAAGLDPG